MADRQTLLRQLPSVDRLVHHDRVRPYTDCFAPDQITRVVQDVVHQARTDLLAALDADRDLPAVDEAHLAGQVDRALDALLRPSLHAVINATGTLLHTNLGRAPLAAEALAAVEAVSVGYSNLELDLSAGQRGHRYQHVEELLQRLTGAEAALVVNNNAGAVLLALTALAGGREALVSRGELVEIGGSFRIPEVMQAGGVALREVGATNKTHFSDYQQAISAQTALLLKVHTSNYRIQGFTETVPMQQLVPLANEHGLMTMEDLGSGMLIDLTAYGLPQEPTVAESVRQGIDVVTFSGDKLLGGPQAGLLVGRAEAIGAIRRHPMARALRVDKMTLAALEATLRLYLQPEKALQTIPVLQMLRATPEALRRDADRLYQQLRDLLGDAVELGIAPATAKIGGGALPLTELEDLAVTLKPRKGSVAQLARRLRTGTPAVVGVIQEDQLCFHLRTLSGADHEQIADALGQVLGRQEADR